jgi:hypothetical protein
MGGELALKELMSGASKCLLTTHTNLEPNAQDEHPEQEALQGLTEVLIFKNLQIISWPTQRNQKILPCKKDITTKKEKKTEKKKEELK